MSKRILVEKVYKKRENTTVPTILAFGNGHISALNKEKTIFSKVLNKDSNSAEALIISGTNVYRGPIQQNELTDQYICIRNKANNKMRIVPIEQACLRHVCYEELARKVAETDKSADLSNSALLRQFGGRKAARFLKNSAEMNTNIDVIRDKLEQVVEQTTLPDMDFVGQDPKYNEKIAPKFDINANELEDVYDIYDIVPQVLLDNLEETAKIVYGTTLTNLPIKTNYLLEKVKKIQSIAAPGAKDFLDLKLCIYMDALLTVIMSTARTLKGVELSRINGNVERDIRQRFIDPNNIAQKIKGFTREKALTYFIALALLTSENYEVSINVLSTTLRIARQRLIPFARIVNATLIPRTDVLKLRLPKNVPELVERKFKRN